MATFPCCAGPRWCQGAHAGALFSCRGCENMGHELCGFIVESEEAEEAEEAGNEEVPDFYCRLCVQNAREDERREAAEAAAAAAEGNEDLDDADDNADHSEQRSHVPTARRNDALRALGPAIQMYADDDDDDGADDTDFADTNTVTHTATQSYYEMGAASQTAGSTSSRSNWNSARQRFEKFLVWLLKAELPRAYDELKAKRDEIAQRLFGRPVNGLAENEILWVNLDPLNIKIPEVNLFAGWLFTHGRRLDISARLIKYKTADCDLSALVSMIRLLAFDLPGEKMPASKIRKIRKGMRSLYDRRAIKENVPLVQSHRTSLESDLLRIVMLCLWSNDSSLFGVAFFVIALGQFAGRATETAAAAFNRVTMKQPEEFKSGHLTADMIPHFDIWRIKGRHEQLLSVFNNRDMFLLCFPFLMFVSMVTTQSPGEYVFPEFHDKAGAQTVRTPETTEAETPETTEADTFENEMVAKAKNLTKYFNACVNKLAGFAETLDRHMTSMAAAAAERAAAAAARAAAAVRGGGNDHEEPDAPVESREAEQHSLFSRIMNLYGILCYKFQEGLGCHSQKRYAVNAVVQAPLISFVTQAFRCGWVTQALHTVFKYADLNASGDRQCARILARWSTADVGGQYGGGRPPRLGCLQGEQDGVLDKVKSMSEFLFADYNGFEGANDRNLQLYLTASFLCRLGDLLDFLKNDPLNRFGTTTEENFAKHGVLQVVFRAAVSFGLGIPELVACGRIIEKDFYTRNYQWVPLDDLDRLRVHDVEGGVPTDRGYNLGNLHSGTLGTFLHTMNSHATHMTASWHDMKECNQDLRAAVLQLSRQNAQLLQRNDQLLQQNAQQTMMLQQILQLQQLQLNGGNGHENAMAPLPLAPLPLQLGVVPTPALPETTRAAAEAITAVSASLPIPESLTQINCQVIFTRWYLGYHRLDCGKPNIRSIVKFIVEYLNLFLDEHIPPEPASVGQKLEWRIMLNEKTKAVWERAERFAERHEAHRLKGKPLTPRATGFKDFMQGCNHNNLPDGPADGECFFQPDSEILRGRQGLIDHNSKVEEQQSRKRRAAEDANRAVADSDGDGVEDMDTGSDQEEGNESAHSTRSHD